jgi:hypothetical protein
MLVMIDWGLRYYPSLTGENETKAGNEELKMLKARGKANAQRLTQRLTALESKLSSDVVGELFYEAGLDSLIGMALDLPDLQAAGNKKTGATAAVSASKAPPPPKKPEMPTKLVGP